MKFNYPDNKGNDLRFSNAYGKYLISNFNTWHGGIHIEGLRVPLKAITDGRIIAYRLNKDYELAEKTNTPEGEEKQYLKYSNSFMLVQHDVELIEEKEETENNKEKKEEEEKKYFTFYSVYNHLMSVNEMEKENLVPDSMAVKKFIVNVEQSMVGIEAYPVIKLKENSYAKDASKKVLLSHGARFKFATDSKKVNTVYVSSNKHYYQRIEFTDNEGKKHDDIFLIKKSKYYTKDGDYYKVTTKVDKDDSIKGIRVREDKALKGRILKIVAKGEKLELDESVNIPGKYKLKDINGYVSRAEVLEKNGLDESTMKTGSLEACDIPIKSGEILGYSGVLQGENNSGYSAAQVDVFTTEDPQTFLNNKFKAGTAKDKKYIALKQGTVLKKVVASTVNLKKNLPVTIKDVKGKYVKIKVKEKIVRVVSVDGNLYTPNNSKNGYKGYKVAPEGYHILNFKGVNNIFNGLLGEGKDSILVFDVPPKTGDPTRQVKYVPKDANKEFWVEAKDLVSTVEYEEEEYEVKVEKELSLFDGFYGYFSSESEKYETVTHKRCVAKEVPFKKGEDTMLSQDIITAYSNVPNGKETPDQEICHDNSVAVFYKDKKLNAGSSDEHIYVECEEIITRKKIKKEGWVATKDLNIEKAAFNAYDWTKFGFEQIDGGDEYMYDIKDLRDKESTESQFIQSLWKKLSISKNKEVVDMFELDASYRMLETQDKISKLVCKHKIEWSYKPTEIKDEVTIFYDYLIDKLEEEGRDTTGLLELKDKKLEVLSKQVAQLMWWDEAKKANIEFESPKKDDNPDANVTTSKTPEIPETNQQKTNGSQNSISTLTPTKEKEQTKENAKPKRSFPSTDMVHHFHPIAFVEQMRLMFEQGGNCDSLIWGNKVSCEFRQRVIQISKRLECDPNHLMTAMALETGGKFDPFVKNKQGYVGLIQIGTDAAADINRRKKTKITTNHLRYMSAELQLKYVEYYLEPHKGKLKTLTDFYLAILWPKAVGQGGNDNFVVFDDDSKSNYNRKAYRQNKSFLKEEGEVTKGKDGKKIYGKAGGKTYVWEIREEIERWHEKGKNYINNCNDGNCTLISVDSSCNICNQKHYDVTDLIHFQSQSQGSSNCGTISRYIIEEISGVSCEGISRKGTAYYQLAIENSSKSGLDFDIEKSKTAIKYLDLALASNIPIRAGVNHTFGGNINEKENPTTDHYVVIVGKKCIEGEIYYQYWDVGTFRGAQKKYRFKLVDGYKLINEDANAGGGKDGRKFTVTQIARATKENRSTLIQLNKKD